jgi:MFS family permease
MRRQRCNGFISATLIRANTWLSDEKGLVEEVVAALFMTGFLAGAVSASFTGNLADRYGRRLACLVFCVIYSLSCLTLLSDDIVILFIGRMLGGVSTTLMYSVFESWMVTEFNKQFPDEPGSTLSGIFSIMTTLNTVVAIIAGVLAEWVTDFTGTEKAPFMTAVACLMLAFAAINSQWVRYALWHYVQFF